MIRLIAIYLLIRSVGSALNPGPRVAGTYLAESVLGENGTVHALKKSITSGKGDSVVSVALFEEGFGVEVERVVKPSLFPGFEQSRVVCTHCKKSIGWFFHMNQLTEEIGETTGEPVAASGVVPYEEEEVDARLEHLKGDSRCLMLPNGWWTLVFCHGKLVEQFHERTRWSMGTYSLHKKERLASTSPGYYTSHFYSNGQHCDETGKGRATEVQFFCCGKGEGRFPHTRDSPSPFIMDMEEPAICKYVMRICVPSLCSDHPIAAAWHGRGDKELGERKDAELDDTASSGGPRRRIQHRPLTAPPLEYDIETMPSDFFAVALSTVVGALELEEISSF